MGTKLLNLRKDDSCERCGAALPAGTRARWDSERRVVTCLACVETATDQVSPTEVVHEPAGVVEATPPPIDRGVAGVSAMQEFERRRARREQRLEETWGTGRIGRLAKFLSLDPQSTTAWATGAAGEERIGALLDGLLEDGAIPLHDRRIPDSKANIDHLVIAPTGIWIVDAKKYKGRVERRDKGKFFTSDYRLYVNGRDQTKLIEGVDRQIEKVRTALDGGETPVRGALCFADAEIGIFTKPFRIDDVWCTWPRKLRELILGGDTVLSLDEVERIARQLAERFPANRRAADPGA